MWLADRSTAPSSPLIFQAEGTLWGHGLPSKGQARGWNKGCFHLTWNSRNERSVLCVATGLVETSWGLHWGPTAPLPSPAVPFVRRAAPE